MGRSVYAALVESSIDKTLVKVGFTWRSVDRRIARLGEFRDQPGQGFVNDAVLLVTMPAKLMTKHRIGLVSKLEQQVLSILRSSKCSDRKAWAGRIGYTEIFNLSAAQRRVVANFLATRPAGEPSTVFLRELLRKLDDRENPRPAVALLKAA